MKTIKKVISLKGLILLAAVSIYGVISCKNTELKSVALPSPQGIVTGFVVAKVNKNDRKDVSISIPDVIVTFYDSLNHVKEKTITDFDGSYRTKELIAGKYRVTFEKDGFGTTSYTIEVRGYTNHPGPLTINLPRQYVAGKALQKDKIPGFYRQLVLGVEIFTTVNIGNEKGVRCNTRGEYILPYTKRGDIIARCEATTVSTSFSSPEWIDITLPNTNPAIRRAMAFEESKFVLRSIPGAVLTMKLDAIDQDGHPLNYKWHVTGGDFTPSPTIPNEARWKLPDGKGTYQLHIVALDNHGGATYFKYDIEAGNREAHFSGIVRNIVTNNPIENALVEVGGITTKTNSKGWFGISVPDKRQKFVLNIDKPGYMLVSKIFMDDAQNQDIPMVEATTQTFNTSDEIVLVEKEDKYTSFVGRKRNEKRKRNAARIKIAHGSLLKQDGNAIASNTNVMVSLRYIDISDENGLMPGDFLGFTTGGASKRLVSYGAIDVQIRDAANPEIKYKLDPRSMADILIPIAPENLAGSPSTIPLWDYDTKTGAWIEIGSLNKSGNSYLGQTNRFSALNTDIAKDDATCLFIKINPNYSSLYPDNYRVKIKVLVSLDNPTERNIAPFPISELERAVVRLPQKTDIEISVIKAAPDNAEVEKQIVNSREAIPGPAERSPDDYYVNNYCTEVFIPKPEGIDSGVRDENRFLTRIENDEAAAIAYYKLIGARDAAGNATETFADWKLRNGFNSGEDAHALYYNHGDLGFWRDMHMKKDSGGKVAYYVSNFKTDYDAVNSPDRAIATVCMEFSPLPGRTTKVTKFYVFNGAGVLQNEADLDGFGLKAVPGLCIVCHGGSSPDYASINTTQLEDAYLADPNKRSMPQFLPFDLQYPNFKYSEYNSGATPFPYRRGVQEPEFKKLNEQVLTTTKTDAIRDFIKTVYGDPDRSTTTLSGTTFLDDQVVDDDDAATPTWNSPLVPTGATVAYNTFYHQIVATSCRTCHMSRESALLTNKRTEPGSISFAVCPPGYMPNARQTYINLWSDIARTNAAKGFLGCP